MAIRTYKVTLDSKNSIAPEPVFLRQGDKTGAVVIDATLMDNGAPVSLDGLTPMFKANTADGQAVIADSTGFNIIDASAGDFTYQVPNALSAVPGKITTAYFSFSDSSGSESTFDVAFIIKKAVDITKPQADEYITIIDGTLNSLQKKIDDMNTDIQTVLNAYNQGDFYNKFETDSKDGATLSSAEKYADSGDSNALHNAKTYTDNSLSGIVALPETFTNLAAIQSKYPNGSNGIMVAADNGHKYIWANSTWTDAGVYQSAGVADNSITLEKLSTSVYTDDYFNLSNINLNGSNTIGVAATFKRAEIINGTSEINLRGTLKENCATNRLSQATFTIAGSKINDLTTDSGDIITSKVISFDKTQRNIEKTLDLNFSVDLQQNPFLKLIISYGFGSNAGTSTDTINLDPLELLVVDENLSLQQKGIFIGNSGTAEISARITGKAGLATTAQLAEFVKKNDIKNIISEQHIYVTTATEFVDAINTAENTATSDQWVTINMAPGTYDLLPFVNLDISEVSALDNRGVEVPRYTKIVGDPAMGTLIVLRLPDDTKTEAKWTVSPINLKNDAWLENLKIISFNCRYAIHDDGGTVSYSRLLKNCILINEGHGTVEFVNETPYGCGIYKGCHAYYDNVTFQGAGMAAYVHDNPTYDIESSLIFNNCTFNGGAQKPDFAVKFHGLGGSADTNIKLINCKLNKPYQVYLENGAVRQSMVITEIGNSLFDDSVSLALSKNV